MKRFDSQALHQALDEKRQVRKMSWSEVAAEIGVSVSTIVRTQQGVEWKLMGCWLWLPGSELRLRLLSVTHRADRST
jgi:hypothetical protein